MPQGDNVRMIPLAEGCSTYVDAADCEWLNRWTWHLEDGYAVRFDKDKKILMHRQIMPPPKGMVVDHTRDSVNGAMTAVPALPSRCAAR